VLGLIGTLAYNLSYLASRRRPPAPGPDALTIETPATNQIVTNSIGTNQPSETGVSEAPARPPFSLEEIAQQAQKPLSAALKGALSPKSPYPERDPFQGSLALRQQVREIEPQSTPPAPTADPDVSTPEPSLRVTAILVQGERRFAVINGYAKRIGASVGSWQIAAIEPDYVLMKTPDGDRKIEIEKRTADAKPEPKP